jgi:hypothetical protein
MTNDESDSGTEDPRPGYWNYRVLRRQGYLTIHEVHYDAEGTPNACTERPAFPSGETLDELREDIRRYSTALDLPVLPFEMFDAAFGPLEVEPEDDGDTD